MNAQAPTHHVKSQARWPLHSVAQTRTIEQQALATLAPHTLMTRAGVAIARLAMAIAPHAENIWVACGPGHNGGDGLEAAVHLLAWGKRPMVTWLGLGKPMSPDVQCAWDKAKNMGVPFQDSAPSGFDLVIDALLGIGASRSPKDHMAQWLAHMHYSHQPVLCVDIPTGLNADTGEWFTPLKPSFVNRHTLSLLTLKPGLFTADGRDAAGQVWFSDLGIRPELSPTAWLQNSVAEPTQDAHNTHKGSFGDVIVIGGAPGMSGAAVLAGLGALHGGAGRVFVSLIDFEARHAVSAAHPNLMVRAPMTMPLKSATVVCGCGGGDAIRALLANAISASMNLVLDADALNAIAHDTSLQKLLIQRSARKKSTVLTPHPLEAARLLNSDVKSVQRDRLQAAQQLSVRFQCTVLLKGSGSVIVAPSHAAVINGSGNALLATAGTGDVLAGLVGAYIARHADTFEATHRAVCLHGQIADAWPSNGRTLDALTLASRVR